MENLDKEPSGIQPGTKIKFVGDRDKDKFPSLQGKCTSSKSGLTPSLNALDAAVAAFSNLEETETLLTKQRRARAIMECVEKVESKKEALESAFEDLITHIHDMESTSFQPPTDPYEMAQSVELTINQKSRETKEKLETHDDAIKMAERILAKQLTLETVLPAPPVQVERQAPAIPIFRAQSDLKPAQLEASSSYMECKHFCEVFSSYLAAGYGGEDRIPQEMICIQLQPFVSAGWWAMMLEDEVKTKDLEGVRQTIMKVAAVHTTLHDRRLEFLRSKKENQTHSDFLRCLEEKIDLCDYKNWSRDQMVTTVFLTFCRN